MLFSCQPVSLKEAEEAFKEGDYEKALLGYQSFAELEPHNTSHHYNLARCFEELERFPEAIKAYDRCIQLGMTDTEAILGRGRVHYKMNKLDYALVDLERAAKSKDIMYDSFMLLGKTYLKTGDPHRAMVLFSQLYARKHSTPELAYYTAVCRAQTGDAVGAILLFKSALMKNPELTRAYYNMAICQEKLEQYDQAIYSLNEAISRDPEDGDYYFRRGLVFTRMERTEMACRDFQFAKQRGNGFANDLIKEYCLEIR